MTSAAKVKANRANAGRSTGPKTTAGKARSAGNARRHGLTAAILEGSAEAGNIEDMALRFLSDTPKCGTSWQLALDAATAQHRLTIIRCERLRLLREAEDNPLTYAGPNLRSDSAVIRESLKKGWRGQDIGSPALQEMLLRLRGRVPRDDLRRHTEMFIKLVDRLAQLDRYEGRAAGQRRTALRSLDRFRACSGF